MIHGVWQVSIMADELVEARRKECEHKPHLHKEQLKVYADYL